MGKSQKKRAARRHNPVRVPDSHLPKGLDAAEATSSRSADVLPIIQKVSYTQRFLFSPSSIYAKYQQYDYP